ncbi:MAG: hypothetical protein GXO10_02770 [Crenarchaeota archaeon]|nr:hypothetical protein [Thermoproteota archaeon]
MMKIFVLGAYPRSAKTRKAIRDLDEGKISIEEARLAILEDTAYICGVQVGAGLSYVQDPAIENHDIFRPFVESWRGVYADGLLRFFDNNFFYRIPVFVEEPDVQKCVISQRVRILKRIVHYYPIKISVPGPVTFSFMSKTELDRSELAISISRAYVLDSELGDSIPDILQLDEPFLTDPDASPYHVSILEECVKELKRRFSRIIISLYYGVPREDVFKRVIELPVEALTISLVEYPDRALSLLKTVRPESSKICIGVIDARDIKVEEYESVKKLVEKTIECVEGRDLYGISTSCGFELIPLKYAIEKTQILGRYGLRISEEVVKVRG